MTLDETGTPGTGDNAAVGDPGANPSLDTGGQGQPVVQEWDNLPKSWTQDLQGDWKSAPENVRKFVHRREADVEKGIRGYADRAARWDRVLRPFQDVLRQQPDLDPAEVYEALASNHLALVNSDAAGRKELFRQMAKHYGVDFAEAAAGQQGAQAANRDGFTEAQINALRGMLSPIVDQFKGVQAHVQGEQQKAVKATVDAFFSDSKNEFVNEVADGMFQIIKSGQTRDLKEAYDLAVLRSPEVKAKYLASLAAQAGGTPPGTGGRNVKSSSAPASTGTPKTIDDTMKAIAAKHYGLGR